MSFGDSQFQSTPWGDIAAQAVPTERADFIRKTYLHLLGAVLAFCALGVCVPEQCNCSKQLAQSDAG